MTWAPRNKSEDEDEDDGDGERKEVERSEKTLDNSEASAEDEGISLHVDTLTDHSCSAESDVEKVNCRVGELRSSERTDVDDEGDAVERHLDARGHISPKPITSSPLTGVEAPILNPHHLHQLHHHLQREDLARNLMASNKALDSRAQSQNPTVKPKLWSLAEIATSDPKHHPQQQSANCSSSSGGLLTAPSSAASPPSLYPPPSIIGRPIYYTSPFYSNYTNYGNFGSLQGQGILRYTNSSGVSLAAAAAAAAAAASSSSSSSANEALSSTQHHHNHVEAKLRPDSPIAKNNNTVVEQLPHQQFRSANLEAKKGT